MRYIWQHIQTIIQQYDGSLPLTHFLKTYFKKYPVLGSRDRKTISEMAYCWYRCSKAINPGLPFETRIHACLFLYSNNQKLVVPLLPPALVQKELRSVQEKLNILNAYIRSLDPGLVHTGKTVFRMQDIFPYDVAFSKGIEKYDWLQSTMTQPRLFIRVRKNREKIISILITAGLTFEWLSDTCLALPNGSAIDKILDPADYVVQDASSQAVGDYFTPQPGQSWWDCCSGAGGKSLYLVDKEPHISLTVSDIRDSILSNLKDRFKLYGLKLPTTLRLDSSNETELKKTLGNKQFDSIICDVPCTGSGTWARTPEQLYFFNPEEQLITITERQRQILQNASQYLAPGGTLYYITCSVFKEENEQVVEQLLQQHRQMQLQFMQLVNGIPISADSLFIAVLTRRSTV